MMRSMSLYMAGLILAFALTGCSDDPKPPANLLQEELYTDLLLETIMVSYHIEMQGLQAKSDSLYSSLFESYGTTRAAFDSSHIWYNRDPTAQKVRIETIRVRLEEEMEKFDQSPGVRAP